MQLFITLSTEKNNTSTRSKGFQININTLSGGVSFKLLEKDLSCECRTH